METFKEGDVVRLKSGGPKMTIQGIGKYGIAATKDNALCVWFDGSKAMEKVYELAVLEHAPAETEKRVIADL